MKLTDLGIKSLKAPEKNSIIYADDALTGFGVRITTNGVRSFVLTHGVCRHRETIGRVGIVSLQEARAEAKRRLAEYTLGKLKAAAVGWNEALAEYLAQVEQKCKPRTHADYKWLLEKRFRFGDTKLPQLSIRDLQGRLDKLAHIPAEQQHAFVVLRAFIRWAYKRGYLDRNPMDKMEEPEGYEARDRVLADDELVKVWQATDDGTFGRIVKLLILTGQRRSEIACLARDMRDNDTITLPPWLTKNSIEHEFPVGPMTMALLPLRDGLLLPARGTDTPFSGWSKSKAKLDRDSGVTGWRLHDLRRTFRTKWEELGIAPAVSERYINHISGEHSGIKRTYNRYRYMKEMREAVAKWEGHLQQLFNPATLSVLMGVNPRGIAMLPATEVSDAALIEEASTREGLVQSGSYCPA